ncbi:RedY protein [Streptomyces violaceoruber]|uniref:RedY protein n=5 Tax=Streptomyces TaxID=1883 RepID=O54144_STRCO|nr:MULTISPECIES: RedY protein [Streptomyces]MBQ0952286.1 RedY protein [Streptomyces sp. RK76]MCW8119387.1 RedY protein [Streptomyces anthocyanicus]MCZ4637453.1 RedY protein [Streptomyces rubrogriseus]MDX2926039.1 RedY protein [Streptomyces sp. NRRL_B-16638]MDX3319091.1 RedY protein [Streptomyces sp. ME03-5684b]
MDVIIHRIRLHDGVDPARFEAWVRDVDYATCPRLPSVRAFAVHRVSTEQDAPFHYFESISVTGPDEFSRDMKTEAFRDLVTVFDTMATVVEEMSGELLEPGYQARP